MSSDAPTSRAAGGCLLLRPSRQISVWPSAQATALRALCLVEEAAASLRLQLRQLVQPLSAEREAALQAALSSQLAGLPRLTELRVGGVCVTAAAAGDGGSGRGDHLPATALANLAALPSGAGCTSAGRRQPAWSRGAVQVPWAPPGLDADTWDASLPPL